MVPRNGALEVENASATPRGAVGLGLRHVGRHGIWLLVLVAALLSFEVVSILRAPGAR
ncbi:MAG TPA: hypothetical protein VI248_05065 [Kineosporiaceae bacterium]